MRDRCLPAKLQERRPFQGLYLRPLPEDGRRRAPRGVETAQAGTPGVPQAMAGKNPAVAIRDLAGQRAGLYGTLDRREPRLHALRPGRPDQAGDGALMEGSRND